MEKVEKIVSETRTLIESEAFKEQNRKTDQAFTRMRKLTFPRMIVLIIQKSVKSLQLRLNEILSYLGSQTVSNSAFTQARANLKHTALISLNDLMLKIWYEDDDYQRYRGFRLLAVDGSKVRLPEGPQIKGEFGAIHYSNQKEEVNGEHNYSQVSVLYDLLNRLTLTAELAKARAYEVDLAIKHLTYTQAGDLILGDRNYATYRFLKELESIDFVIRCSASSFKVAREMLQGQGADSQVIDLAVNRDKFLKVRFVRVTLSTGEDEVLVTSLIEESTYPTEMFKELYHLRWGVETFYSLLKTRLELEHFSGKTVESLYQDFYAAVYLTGLESVLTKETNHALKTKNTSINPQQVNHNVSFHALKSEALNLLLSDIPIPTVLNKLHALFLTNPTLNKNKPSIPRNKKTTRRLLYYHRNQRQHCF